MATISAVLEAKQKFQVKFPKLHVGIGGVTNNHYLNVWVKTDDEAKRIPKEFEGIRMEVRTMGHITKS